MVCTHCQQRESDLDGLMSCCHDDRLQLLQVRPGEELICEENFSDETVKVPGWEMWFEVSHSQVNAIFFLSQSVGMMNCNSVCLCQLLGTV